MSAVEAIVPASEVPNRLRSIAGIEPARLPGLMRLAALMAEAAGDRLREASLAPPSVTLEGVERIDLPAADDETLFPENGIFAPLTGPSFEEPGFLASGPGLLDTVVGAFFGGDRIGADLGGRLPTALDRSLVDLAYASVAAAVEETMRPLSAPQILKEELCDHAEVGELLGEEPGPAILVRLALSVAGSRDYLCVILPERLFTPHRRFLSVVPKEEKPPLDPDWLRDMETGVSRSSMSVRVVLSTQDLPLQDVACFAVGQTIELASTLESLVDIEIEGRRFFRGHVGKSRDNYVVRVDGQIDPAQEFLDDILSD